jgi:hypothetical protein
MANETDYTKLAELGVLGGLGAYNANKARQDANTQINDIRSSQAQFGPDSPYAQQLRQQLERRDAQKGRRSQYGPREVELQAKLAEVNARQQAQNAPTLNTLYQQKQGARTSTGRDVASIIARSGGLSKLSPFVQGLFKKRDLGDNRDAGQADGYNYSPNTSQPGISVDNNYDSYDFGGQQDLGYNPSTYDSYDFSGASDSGVDYSSAFDTSYANDYSAGLSDTDYSSVFAPGYAEGGKVNIFEALSPKYQAQLKQNESPYRAPNQNSPKLQESIFKKREQEEPSDTQTAANTARTFNGISTTAGMGDFLGPGGSMVAALAGSADNQDAYVNSALSSGISMAVPLLGVANVMGNLLLDVTGRNEGDPRRVVDTLYERGANNRGGIAGRDRVVRGTLGGMGMTDEAIDKYMQFREQNPDSRMFSPPTAEATPTETEPGQPTMPAATNDYATGGHVQGPGTGTSDSILARLSDGEYVNTAKTVDSLGTSLFDKLEAKAKRSTPEELKKFKAGLQALF